MQIEKICGIYMITSPSGKIYIGQSQDILRRWQAYKKYEITYQKRLARSFRKHGVENHCFKILEECEKSQLDNMEIQYIKLYDTFDTPHGLNLTSGGESYKLAKESLEKISTSLKARRYTHGKRKLSESTKKKISKSLIGNTRTLGKKQKPETIEKISKALIGNTHTLGKKQKPETIEKRRKSLMGKNKGKKYGPMSEEGKQKRRESCKIAWEIKKKGEEYNSEENIKKRKENSQIATMASIEYFKRIKQEKLTMVF